MNIQNIITPQFLEKAIPVACVYASIVIALPVTYFLDLMPFTSDNENSDKVDICTFLQEGVEAEAPILEKILARTIISLGSINIDDNDDDDDVATCSTFMVWGRTTGILFTTAAATLFTDNMLRNVQVHVLSQVSKINSPV